MGFRQLGKTAARGVLWGALVVAILLAGMRPAPAQDDGGGDAYFPGATWRASTPEAQGVDSAGLAEALDYIRRGDLNINSVTVIRHGYKVLDVALHPYDSDELHRMNSVSKSVTSTLVGIAIDEGLIEGVEVPILDLFPAVDRAILESEKAAITLEDVLMMASGLDCRDSYAYQWRGLREMRASDSWVEHMLNLPLVDTPGERFEYCNGATYLLSAAVEGAARMPLFDYAQATLFEPLGITDVAWETDERGHNISWAGVSTTPDGMARLGYLFLQDGIWAGEQIVAPEWVARATIEQVRAGTLADGYGYQWWIDDDGYYMALGYAGQVIAVVPERDMVVAISSGLEPRQHLIPQIVIESFIIPAAQSDEPLPANPAALDDLEATIQALTDPQPQPVPPLPDTALESSGRRYELEPNDLDVTWIMLAFEPVGDTAVITLRMDETDMALAVGLDGVARVTDVRGQPVALEGTWTRDNVFTLRWRDWMGPTDLQIRMTFDGDTVQLLVRNRVNTLSERIAGTAAGD